MKRIGRTLLALAALLLVGLAGSPHAVAQGRGGGPPMGLPPGGPFGSAGGPAGGIGGAGGLPRGGLDHGPPSWALDRAGAAASRIDHVPPVLNEKLAVPERERAAELVRANPGVYEIDRNGAAVVRGEVLASGLDAPALALIERAGFTIARREDLSELGVTLAVISRPDMAAGDVLKRLHRILPGAEFTLNHVLYGSAAAMAGGAAPAGMLADRGMAGSSHSARVGLIDTGVSTRVDAMPHVRVVRRAFAPGAERPDLHGTAVAALIATPPGAVAIYAAGIFTEARAGSSDLLLSALGWLAAERVPVINISMVGPPNPIVAIAVGTLIRKGFTVVAPVGNDGPAARPLYPASYPGVIAVSAVGADDRLLPEASRVGRVDFAAAGIARVPDGAGRETTVRGTSFAAPVVSRLLAERIAAPDPGVARAAVAALARTARKSPAGNRWLGHGVVRAD